MSSHPRLHRAAPRARCLRLVPLVLLAVACGGGGGGGGSGGGPPPAATVDVVRDRYGVPHVYAATDRGAYYGLGWACAEDRFLQMSYLRLAMQGRMAEVFGRDSGDGSDEYVDHDVRMRRFGYARLASTLVVGLDPETRGLLEAYADGVNDYVQSPGAILHPLLASTGIPVEPWTPEDCVLLWMRLARFFGGAEPLGEAQTRHAHDALVPTLGVDGATDVLFPDRVLDEEAAVVQQADVPASRQAAIASYAAQFGLPAPATGATLLDERAHFSHAWAVSGARTTTGRAVLVGDPRLPLRNPNSLWEAHVVGATFEVRGVTPAGSPNFLVGSTDSVAWSVTAMRLDQADLFELVLDPSDPSGRYMLDGLPTAWAVDEVENVLVAGGAPVPVRYRETVWGPVLTGFPGDASLVADVQPGEEFAVKWVGRAPGVSAPARGWLAAYRAGGAASFGQALGGVAYPGLNCVFADAAGSIGYWVVGALPLRSDPSPLGGQASVDGSVGASDWLDLVPHDLKPWVIDPADGFVYSANHLPVGGWYPLPFVSKGGHTVRSWRLRERLDDLLPTPASVVDPAAVVAVHEDGGWPLARDAVQLGLHLRDDQPLVAGQPFTLQADALSALAVLESWADAGGDGAGVGDVRDDGLLVANRPQASALARWVGLVPFRPQTAGGAVDPALTAAHGQGESGFAFFLRERVEGIRATPRVDLDLVSAQWVDHVLAEGWRLANTRLGPPAGWANWFQTVHLVSTVAGWVDLEGFPSLDPGVSADLGPVTVAFGETILSQFQQSYTQVVEPGAPDATLSLLPGGQFENPASDLRQAVYDDQLSGWFQDPQGLKPAPLSRTAVEALAGPTVTTTLDEPTAP